METAKPVAEGWPAVMWRWKDGVALLPDGEVSSWSAVPSSGCAPFRRPTSATTPVVPMTLVTTLSVGGRFHGAMHNGSTGWSNRTCGQLSIRQKRRTFRDQFETWSQSVGREETG